MRYLISTALVVVAIIHLLPLAGVLGADRLQSLYGVALDDPALVLLMRHRAVLFGVLGTYILVAAFVPELQLSALLMGAVSVASFLILAWLGGGYNASVSRVVAADWIAAVSLVVGGAAYFLGQLRS